MALPELFFSPCQEPPYRISGSTRQFHWKGCLYGAHILGNGRCRSYTSTFHKSFPAQWAVAYLNDILSRETAIVVKHSHPQHSLPVYSHLNAAVFNGLVHWNKIICPRLTVWTSHRINLSYLLSESQDIPTKCIYSWNRCQQAKGTLTSSKSHTNQDSSESSVIKIE